MTPCSQCGEAVDEHVESRETDFCVGLAKGLIKKVSKGWYEIEVFGSLQGSVWVKARKKDITGHNRWLPLYSSPPMDADTWGLVERMFDYFHGLFPNITMKDEHKWGCSIYLMKDKSPPATPFVAPTPELAICRAFLAKKEEG